MDLGREHRRKVTFKIYPGKVREKALVRMLGIHCDLYNAALHGRMDAYAKFDLSISCNDRQRMLPGFEGQKPELAEKACLRGMGCCLGCWAAKRTKLVADSFCAMRRR